MINESIAKLVKYGENAGLVSGLDKIYATNRILEVMQISDYEEPEQIPETPDLEETLNELLDDAAKRGLLEHNSVVYRDLFDTKLMDCLMPRPGEVVKKFEELYAKSPQEGNRQISQRIFKCILRGTVRSSGSIYQVSGNLGSVLYFG